MTGVAEDGIFSLQLCTFYFVIGSRDKFAFGQTQPSESRGPLLTCAVLVAVALARDVDRGLDVALVLQGAPFVVVGSEEED